ncbi:MAG: PIN domain-containing protein [Fulvivirga sp.]
MKLANKVLVDSSAWISFFSSTRETILWDLISEDLICTNELILTELIPFLLRANNQTAADSLLSIECIPLSIDWELIRKYQSLNLSKGINKVGIPDLIILQQVIEHKLPILTNDKHFYLMKKHLHFEILDTES